MKYKALMLDVDGTIVPIQRDSLPSKKVIQAIKKANKLIHIGVATSRPYYVLKHILDLLDLNGFSIINGGAQIMDVSKRKIVWEKGIDKKDVIGMCNIIQDFGVKPKVLENDQDIPYTKEYIPKNPLQVWAGELTFNKATKLAKKLSKISSITVHQVISWRKDKFDLVINHAEATKQHGIFEVSKLLKIKTSDIIGVGDGYNDFPLLMACGLKVAMESAPEDLKAIADFIAPSVEKDGVVEVINKYIL
ncbi:HAD family phosphatase [Candidatus Daviesbacteria bacterium]|nr:HAD family phosphatase [Candidatus Daviesbacteria bacterium]